MSNLRRNCFRVTAGLAILITLLLLCTLDRVDYSPAIRQPYYAETLARLHATLATNHVAHGEILAGFGRALLTPISANGSNSAPAKFTAVPLAGYGDRKGRPASGVHDDVFVKAMAIRVGERLGIMAGADALIVPEEVASLAAKRLQTELHLDREQIYLGATHTHSSLGGWGSGPVAEAFAGKFQAGIREWFANCIVGAVSNALVDLKPASVGEGRFVASEFVRNRLVGNAGTVDPEFTFILIQQQGGSTGVLGSFAAHATVLPGEVMQFSGDYPGAWERAVERRTGGVALFLAGGVGSHSPVPEEKAFTGAERMGNTLAALLLDELPSVTLTNSIDFGTAGVEVSLPPLNWRVSDSIRLRPWLAQKLLHAPRHVFVQAFRIGNCVWLSTPCDFSGEAAITIKETMRARGGNAVVTSFNGSYIGYVIPARYYHLPGYEPRLMSFFGPNVPDYLDEILRTLATGL